MSNKSLRKRGQWQKNADNIKKTSKYEEISKGKDIASSSKAILMNHSLYI